MGVDALKAEREVTEKTCARKPKLRRSGSWKSRLRYSSTTAKSRALKARDTNAPFSEEYNSLREENTLLRANQIDVDDVDVTQVINWAYRPDGPDSPKKLLILALSVVLGGMLGIFVLMVARLIRGRN